jgi:hypothetical protein
MAGIVPTLRRHSWGGEKTGKEAHLCERTRLASHNIHGIYHGTPQLHGTA